MNVWRTRNIVLALVVVALVVSAVLIARQSTPDKDGQAARETVHRGSDNGSRDTGPGSASESPERAELQAKDVPTRIDAAIARGADFLRNAQNEDGGWGSFRGSDVGITGLVLDALVKAPQPVRDANADLIEKGANYILANRRDNGALVNDDGFVPNYRTSIAVRALIAVDAKKYKDTIDGAVRYVKSIQNEDGGMGYGGGGGSMGGGGSDLTNTAESIEMLAAAGIKEDDPAYQRAMTFLGKVQCLDEYADPGVKTDNSGGAIYRPGHAADKQTGGKPTIKLGDGTLVYRSYGSVTYALLMSQLFCGMKKDNPRVQAAYKWVCDNYTVQENPEQGQRGLYYYYYTMVRTLQLWGSPTIQKNKVEHNWPKELALELISKQKKDGSWFNSQDQHWEGDRSLVTAYSLFTLDTCREMLGQPGK